VGVFRGSVVQCLDVSDGVCSVGDLDLGGSVVLVRPNAQYTRHVIKVIFKR
jgi:hypothetical protein